MILWLAIACRVESEGSPPGMIAVPVGSADADGDGWSSSNGDCDDGDSSIHPEAPEVPGDEVDDNCDGTRIAAVRMLSEVATGSFRPEVTDPKGPQCTGDGTAAVTDVTGDAVSDLAFGASGCVYSHLPGRVYFLEGPLEGEKSGSDAFAVIRSSDDPLWGGLGGMVVGDLGDLDGDGWPEVYDGAPLADDGSGRLDLFSTPLSGSMVDDDADISIREVDGGIDFAAVGSAVTRLDPPNWAFAGLSLTDSAASVFVVGGYPLESGPADLVASVRIRAREGDAAGELTNADLDGDGTLDLIVGLPSTADDADLLVAVPGPVDTDATLEDVGTEWTSPFVNDQLGESVAALSDFDGDGRTDLVVGAFGSSDSFVGGGAAYLVLGDNLDGSTHDILDSTLRVQAENPLDSLGDSVAALGDLDGDGLSEIGITASRSMSVSVGVPTLTPARVYLIRSPGPEGVVSAADLDGALTGTVVSQDIAAYGNGWSTLLAAAGDTDGNGLVEFLVGSPLVSGGYYERVGRVDVVEGWPF